MTRRPAALFAVTVASVLLVDQVSKAVVRTSLGVGQSIPVIEDILSLTHVSNRGAAFGLFQGAVPFFIATSLVVLGVIAWIWWRMKPTNRWFVFSLGLVTGGAAGNLIDRASAGRVTDFFDVHIWPVFNVADMALDIGVAILVAWLLFSKEAAGTDEAVLEEADAAEGPSVDIVECPTTESIGSDAGNVS
ncbi:MAG: signal peptidase II [Coriobacteriia bacterium]